MAPTNTEGVTYRSDDCAKSAHTEYKDCTVKPKR